jgi:general secretion pathway protein H
MPTSAAGNSRSGRSFDRFGVRRTPHASARRAGFTLLELLVVIAIIALATVGVTLSLRDTGQVALEREAERLAALLEAARSQSRASGVAVRWRVTEQGFVFDGLPVGSLPTGWLDTETRAQSAMGDGRAADALLLGPEPIIAAQQVELTSAGPPARSLRVATDGLRPFAVVTAP